MTGFRGVRGGRGICSHADPSSQREVSDTAIYSMGWPRFNLPKYVEVDLWTSQGLTTVT